ncbi:MAG: hypothetical protein CM15mP113_1120 [Pseudomonadota bacterium]|nr:MAG: hypothetical protein CM15mP113_1120 [Pseudomonadota bacterium]
MSEFERSASRIRTRWIAVTALIISNITFGSGLLVFAYMKSPAFENQLLEQVMKNMDWIVILSLRKKTLNLNLVPFLMRMIQTNGFGIILKREIKE